jgi:hypothetical protein
LLYKFNLILNSPNYLARSLRFLVDCYPDASGDKFCRGGKSDGRKIAESKMDLGRIGGPVGGLVYDAVWHGLLNPDFEAVTVDQMVHHLTTVHLPLYIGVVSVLVTTTWALVSQMRRSPTDVALAVAFAGAIVSTAGKFGTLIVTCSWIRIVGR